MDISEWINTKKAQGSTQEQIRAELVKQGYTDSQADDALGMKSEKKLNIIFIVIPAIIILLGLGVWIMLPDDTDTSSDPIEDPGDNLLDKQPDEPPKSDTMERGIYDDLGIITDEAAINEKIDSIYEKTGALFVVISLDVTGRETNGVNQYDFLEEALTGHEIEADKQKYIFFLIMKENETITCQHLSYNGDYRDKWSVRSKDEPVPGLKMEFESSCKLGSYHEETLISALGIIEDNSDMFGPSII